MNGKAELFEAGRFRNMQRHDVFVVTATGNVEQVERSRIYL